MGHQGVEVCNYTRTRPIFIMQIYAIDYISLSASNWSEQLQT